MANEAKIVLSAEDRTRAAFQSVERGLTGVADRVGTISQSLSGLAAGAGIGALGLLVNNAIAAQAALDDFAEATGVSVASADKLYQVARISGTELGTLHGIVLQLNKALFLNDQKDSSAAKALDAIGLAAEDLRRQSPEQALQTIAQRLREFEDGADKSAVTLALFGKKAAEVAPFLNDLATAGELQSRVTAEQAAQAEKLTKEWNKLGLQTESLGFAIANRIVPAMNTLIETIKEYARHSGGIGKGLANLAEDIADPQSILSLEKQIADKARELRQAQDDGDARREARLTGEIVQLQERLRLQKAISDEAKKAADDAAKAGSRGKIDAGGIKDKEPAREPKRLSQKKEIDAETEAIIRRYEIERELQKAAGDELAEIHKERQGRLDEFLAQIEDEEQAREKANLQIANAAEKYRELADPLSVYRNQLAEILQLEAAGELSAEEASAARAAVTADQIDAAERLNGTLIEQNDIGRELGMTFSSAFEDAIIEGQNLRAVLQGMAKDIARKPLAASIAGLFSGTGGGAAPAGSSGGGNLGGWLNAGSSAFNASSTSAYLSGAAETFAYSSIGQSLGLSTAGTIAGPTVSGGALSGGLSAGGQVLSTIASWAPYIAIAVALYSMFSKGATPHAGAVSIGDELTAQNPRTLAGFDAFYTQPRAADQFYESDFTKRFSQGTADALNPLAVGLAKTFNTITREYAGQSGFKVGVGFSADDDDKSRGRFSIIDSSGGELTEFRRRFSHDPQTGLQQFGIAATQGLIAGLRELDLGATVNAVLDKSLQGSTDYLTQLTETQTGALLGLLEGGVLDELFANVDIASLSWAEINQEIAEFSQIANLKPLFDALGVSIFDLGTDITAALGGVEAAGQSLSAYYEAYYSDSERIAQASQDLANEFAALGIEMPESKGAFRDLVESLDLTTQEGRDTYAALMRLSPAFATVADSANNIANQMADVHNMFAGSIRDIRLSTLDDPGKYAFLDKEGARQRDVLASLSDPDLIRDYAGRLNETITQAFSLLDADTQKAKADEFIARLQEADELAQERLEAANKEQRAVFEQLPGDIEQAVDAPMQRAVSAIEAAMRAGIRIDLRLPAGFEVG